jgi:hypothetical protein
VASLPDACRSINRRLALCFLCIIVGIFAVCVSPEVPLIGSTELAQILSRTLPMTWSHELIFADRLQHGEGHVDGGLLGLVRL